MKKYGFLIMLMFVFASCNTHQKELQQASVKADSLKNQIATRDQTVNGFLSDFNSIQDNLNTIKEKENIISMNSGNNESTTTNKKDLINKDINDIYSLLIKNKHLIASLNKRVKDSKGKLDEFQKTIAELTRQDSLKDRDIINLKDQIAMLNTKVTSLDSNLVYVKNVSTDRQMEIDRETAKLNTAYYIVGTKQELKEKKVVTKEGGLLGIGNVPELADNGDKKDFSQIDITQTTTIPINKKKVTLITTHPVGSYQIEGDKDHVKDIKIVKPDEFWSESKLLVAMVR